MAKELLQSFANVSGRTAHCSLPPTQLQQLLVSQLACALISCCVPRRHIDHFCPLLPLPVAICFHPSAARSAVLSHPASVPCSTPSPSNPASSSYCVANRTHSVHTTSTPLHRPLRHCLRTLAHTPVSGSSSHNHSTTPPPLPPHPHRVR